MNDADRFDVAIVGGGPAGLSAAVVLGRCRRRVVVMDNNRPRNYAARQVNCYLGVHEPSPAELRELGRRQAEAYDVQFRDVEVIEVRRCDPVEQGFELCLEGGQQVASRKLLLATGLRDTLPDIPGLRDLYGVSVHHCPYCDGWEHRDQRLAALGQGSAAVKLAISLHTWSDKVTACTMGQQLDRDDGQRLERMAIPCRSEQVQSLIGSDGKLEEVRFVSGEPLACDALFFSADKSQRSGLPQRLGCECDEQGLIMTGKKQGAGQRGLFLAGDADGDTQFAIVAAAEGAVAATAINAELQVEDFRSALA